MTNYNAQLQSNNVDLQAVIQVLQTKAAGSGGEQATPEISLDVTNGLITATAGIKSSTYQLAFQPAKIITPSTTSQVAVSSGYYTGGDITVAAVPTQSKSVTPTSSVQNVTPDSGKFLSKVTVDAIPSTYVQPTATKGTTTYTPTTTAQTIASGTYLTGVQTIAGDSNLIASNIVSGVSIFGVNGTYVGSTAPADNYEDEILNGALTSYTNTTVDSIKIYAFYNCYSLKTVNLTACEHIGQQAFQNCTSLSTVTLDNCISMASSAFQGCTKLTSISFPKCKSIYWAGFSGCTSLASIDLPACTYLGGRAFQNCYKLSTVSLPLCRNIYSSTFQSCSALTTISLPSATLIGSTAFGSCTNLSTFYLTGSSVCGLSGSNVFTGTGITNSKGSIYVTASLVDSYKTATNWAYFSNVIYEFDNGE